MTLRVGSLCSGYGGLDLGLELALGPIEHAWHVEYDRHPSMVLAHHWPDVPNHGDLTTLDHNKLPPVDWITAGYPCQPFSQAGKRKGSDDERHLWPYVADTIGRVRPRNVLLENVRGHLSLGLADVLADLSSLGYDARWGLVRASDAGAPHGRARIFIVATDTDYADGRRRDSLGGSVGRAAAPRSGEDAAADAANNRLERSGRARDGRPGPQDGGVPAADPDRLGRQRHTSARPGQVRLAGDERLAWGPYARAVHRWERAIGRPAPRPTELGRTAERLSPRFVEWMMGLPAGWVTDVPGLTRSAQLKALGNGVVPQQAALALRLLGVSRQEVAA